MFSVLGPLINPARPRGIGPTFSQCSGEGGVERALVVCGYERLDEISCAGPTHVWELKNGKVTKTVVKPDNFGLPCHPLHTVTGGLHRGHKARTRKYHFRKSLERQGF